MKRTTLIAALASIIPLAASTFTAQADPFHRPNAQTWGHSGVYRPVVPHYGPRRPFFDRFYFHRNWAPRPHWRAPRYWR